MKIKSCHPKIEDGIDLRLFPLLLIDWHQVYNPEAERWRVVGDLSSPRRGLTLTVGKLVMIRWFSLCVLQVRESQKSLFWNA